MADDGYFGEDIAAHYDDVPEPMVDGTPVDEAARVLAELAQVRGGGGASPDLANAARVLEFAIGTGRVALPLAGLGVDVHGIEMSTAMVRRLRAKPGGAEIPVTIGDMTSTR